MGASGPEARPWDAAAALAAMVARLPGAERRDGQVRMAEAVEEAVAVGRPLLVQAGAGTGKTLAYLAALAAAGQPAVVATATKTLQDQLAHKDLPLLAAAVAARGRPPLRWAVLKGRSNYLCRQRLAELGADGQLALAGLGPAPPAAELARLAAWAETSAAGERSALTEEVSDASWTAVSVGPRECAGALRCPEGPRCFAEAARQRAAEADVVVVNHHLYALHLTGAAALPEHEVVILDEAHLFEATVSAVAGVELSAGRVRAWRRLAGGVLRADDALERLDAAADDLAAVLGEHCGRRLAAPAPRPVQDALTVARHHASGLLGAVRALPDAALGVEARGRRQRALQAGGALLDDLDAALAVLGVLGAEPGHDQLGWVEGEGGQPRLRVAPLDVAPLLAERLWTQPAVVLTSATLPSGLADRLGLAPGAAAQLDVGSPFDYPASALLYCAAHLPDPRSAAYEAAAQRELEALIVAAGGRTLALFTSWRAMRAAADALATRLPWRVLTQAELPKPALLAAFAEDETSCLFATMSFWQGVDVVGPSLSLVVIDRLPFPRPDDPLLSARRDRAGPAAFRTIDLPRAGALLAQGAGRLIRSRADRGVVAVLDRRLATAASYRWELIRALPPMRRTKDPAEAAAVLRTLRDERTAALTPSVQ